MVGSRREKDSDGSELGHGYVALAPLLHQSCCFTQSAKFLQPCEWISMTGRNRPTFRPISRGVDVATAPPRFHSGRRNQLGLKDEDFHILEPQTT